MNYTYLHYQIGLDHLYGVGPRIARTLLERTGSLSAIFESSYEELSVQTGYSESFLRKMKRVQALEKSSNTITFNEQNRIRHYFFSDHDYPERLKHCGDAPLNLFSLGDISLNDGHFVGVVGTRSATKYGQQFCEQLIRSFIDRNITVVSGLANGIDSYAHYNCIKYGVPTLAVLGHGLDRIYPSNNKRLAKEMLNNGALLTEFGPDTNPDRENFPKRNRIVAGMCDAIIVVESKTKGGSLITAELANDYNRDVFALPGDIYRETSSGCNLIISNNQAHLLEHPNQFLKIMGWDKTASSMNLQRKVLPKLSEFQRSVLDLITEKGELHLDQIALSLKRNVSSVNVELLALELEGVIVSCGGNRYRSL